MTNLSNFKITKAKLNDSQTLADIGRISFIESHGHSASANDINQYLEQKYTKEIFEHELRDTSNIYHLIYCNEQIAGYSKLILNAPHLKIESKNVSKLERLYLLKEFYGLNLGLELLQFNIALSKQNQQTGMWLFVWTENKRAFEFYKKTGFKIIGSHDFKISATHANPNHQMFLKH